MPFFESCPPVLDCSWLLWVRSCCQCHSPQLRSSVRYSLRAHTTYNLIKRVMQWTLCNTSCIFTAHSSFLAPTGNVDKMSWLKIKFDKCDIGLHVCTYIVTNIELTCSMTPVTPIWINTRFISAFLIKNVLFSFKLTTFVSTVYLISKAFIFNVSIPMVYLFEDLYMQCRF